MDTVLGKAIAVLRAFSADDHELSLSALVERTGLPKTSVHRIAGDLVHHRLLDRTSHGYRLSGGLFELGMRASLERGLAELSMPFLQDLYERTHEIVHLGLREGHEVVYVAKITGRRQARSPSRAGGRMPLYCTAIGKVLLAWSDEEVRRAVLTRPMPPLTAHTITAPGRVARQLDTALSAGVAFEREESALGIQCVAAPVLDLDNKLVAAISVTGPVGRFRPEQHADAVRAAAHGLGALVARRTSLRPDPS
ncbi:IclR family transcriptional regulator [Nocardioides pelophilus]|uniref:IclR family transcriptional regulator n=1 Tax=Nocardioides pelophilus TaxID=2172019 RepID=UPI0028B04610|nr:IclR family transcriptional regulator [Nocardioides pelophilus]